MSQIKTLVAVFATASLLLLIITPRARATDELRRPGEIIVRYRAPITAPPVSVTQQATMGEKDAGLAVRENSAARLAYRSGAELVRSDRSENRRRLAERFGLRRGKPLCSAALAAREDHSEGTASADAPFASDIWLLEFDRGADISVLCEAYRSDPGVVYAEPNYVGSVSYKPTDPFYSPHMAADFSLVGMEDAWDIQQGVDASLVVASIDSGVEIFHPDLGEAINLAASYNFVENNTRIFDDLGHGTRVAGIIGAVAKNGEGIAGVAFGCSILSLDVATSTGQATSADVASAIYWAVARGADVINLSLRFTETSRALEEACNAAYASGALLVAAAGNENQGERAVYPASYAAVIGVAAVLNDGVTRAPFSNYNDIETANVELAAPGDTIFSTSVGSQYSGLYGSGTSFAAPIVAGAAALLRAHNPTQSNVALRQHLAQTATPIGNWAGNGRLNAAAALQNAMEPKIRIVRVIVHDSPALNPNNDNDGALDPGESARLSVTLTSDAADAEEVVATLSAQSFDIGQIADATASFGPVRHGEMSENSADPFRLITVSATPAQQQIPFILKARTSGDYKVTLLFDLPIEKEETISGDLANKTFNGDTTYRVAGDLQILGATTIQPGAVFKVDPGARITVTSNSEITAIGTAEKPILFTSVNPYGTIDSGKNGSGPLGAIGPQNGLKNLSDYSAKFSEVRHVSALTGSDSNGDGSPGAPWRTIGHALSQISPSSTTQHALLVAHGRYIAPSSADYALEMRQYVDIYGGFDPDSWQRDIFRFASTIDGQAARAVVLAADNARLDGFILVGGATLSDAGGGVLCDGVSPTIANNTIRGNTADAGGAIACLNGAAPLITNNTISGNSTWDLGEGGGVYSEASSPRIVHNQIINNMAASGAGIQCVENSFPFIANNIISANSVFPNESGGGGGIHCSESSYTIAQNTISGNSATLEGGGIFATACPASRITDNLIYGNDAISEGGGIYLSDSSPNIANNVIAQNSAEEGGAIYCLTSSAPSIINCTVSENRTHDENGEAGGVYCEDAESRPDILNTILWGNSAAQIQATTATLSHCDIQGGWPGLDVIDADPRFVGPVAWGAVKSAQYNPASSLSTLAVASGFLSRDSLAGRSVRIGPKSYTIKSNTASTLLVWGDAASGDTAALPEFWEVRDFHLRPSSPCVDLGKGPTLSSSVPRKDIDGDSRSGTLCDIGADEYAALTMARTFSAWGQLRISPNAAKVDLQNCVFENGQGVLNEMNGASILNSTFRLNSKYGLKSTAQAATIQNNIAELNLGAGIDAPGAALEACEALYNRGKGLAGADLIACLARGNIGDGLTGLTAQDSTADFNRGGGCVLMGAALRVTARDNRANGIRVEKKGDITDCEAIRNGGVGIELLTTGSITGSLAIGNKAGGIVTNGSEVANCVVRDNGETGVVGGGSTTLSDTQIVRSEGPAATGLASVSASIVAGNRSGLTGAATVTSSYITHNGNYGVAGGVITDSVIFRNGTRHNRADGVLNPLSIANSWVFGNTRFGVVSDGAATVSNASIQRNQQGGVENVKALTNSNIYDNKPYEAAYTLDSLGAPPMPYTNNYWGPTSNTQLLIADELSTATAHANMPFILDSYDPGLIHALDIWDFSRQEIPDAPSDLAPPFLLEVSPNLTTETTVGATDFICTFTKPMDTDIAPTITFGIAPPYTRHFVIPNPGWISPTTWKGLYAIETGTGDTTNTIRVSNAQAADGFPILDDTTNAFLINSVLTGSAALNNGQTQVLTSNSLLLQWSSNNLPAGSKGFNIRRSATGEPGSYQKINSTPLSSTTYTDNTGLAPDTLYFYIVDMIDANDSSTQWTPPFYGLTLPGDGGWEPSLPIVENLDASGVTETNAILRGNLIDTGGENPAVRIHWGAADGGQDTLAWNHVENLGTRGAGSFSAHLANLAPNTTYYFTSMAVNSAGETWAAPTKSFTTPQNILPPAIANTPPANITTNSASIGGNLTSTGGENSQVHIYWGETDGGANATNWDHDETTISPRDAGPFSVTLRNLLPNTRYYYRCSAANSQGTAWAIATETFATENDVVPPTVINTPATNITSDFAIIGGEIISTGGDNPEVHIAWGETDGGAQSGNWQNDINLGARGPGAFTLDLIDLELDTTYYYRSYAVNSVGYAWAPETASFKTFNFIPPTVSTGEATNITEESVILGGELLTTGGEMPEVYILFGEEDGGTEWMDWEDEIEFEMFDVGTFSTITLDVFPDTLYYYRAFAVNSAGEAWGEVKTFTTPPPLGYPKHVRASDGTYPGFVRVTWEPVPNATHYQVYRAISYTDPEEILTPWQTATTFDDTTAVPGTLYYYWVAASADAQGERISDESWENEGYAPLSSDLKTYKITYKNCELNIVDGAEIVIADNGLSKSTVKIKLLKLGIPQTPAPGVAYIRIKMIPLLEITSGNIKKFHSDASIAEMRATGVIKSLTTKNAYIAVLHAAVYGHVKMAAAPNSTDWLTGERYWAQVWANGGPVPPEMAQAKITLTGVGLSHAQTPDQSLKIKVAAKKGKVKGGDPFFSLADVGDEDEEWWDDDDLEDMDEMDEDPIHINITSGANLSITVKGGAVWGNILALGDISKIAAKATWFSYDEDMLGGYFLIENLKSLGSIGTLSTTGGTMELIIVTAQSGIKKLSSKNKNIRNSGFEYYGGEIYLDEYLSSGFDSVAFYETADIGTIYGATGVYGGIFYAGADSVVIDEEDGEVEIVPNFRGRIKKVATRKPVEKYDEPTIEGEAYVNQMPKMQGDWEDWFEIYLPGSL